jgi:uncharacterized protein
MSLKLSLENDLKDAMRNNQVAARNTIRMVLTSIKLSEVEKGNELSDTDILSILQKEIKMRQETIHDAEKGNRVDIISPTKEEISVLEKYLPKQLSPDELIIILTKLIKDVDAKEMKDMGKVMKVAIPEIAGKASNEIISQMIRALLSQVK